MSSLDVDLLRRSLSEPQTTNLDELEVFASIASTNTHLLAKSSPAAGRYRVAIADHQTSGRGRQYRRWLSPAGASLSLSLAYTFAGPPKQLPALTLAIGAGVMGAMGELDVSGVSLKWPNDIVALDGKLGGILTEIRSGPGASITVVTGIGLNIDLPETMDLGFESEWAHRPVDLKRIRSDHPPREVIAATIINAVYTAMTIFEERGFAAFVEDWQQYDWLRGKEITVESQEGRLQGVASGIDEDGALLVGANGTITRVISGSIIIADQGGSG